MKTPLICLSILVTFAVLASAEQFAVAGNAGTDTVAFASTAKLEFIQGKTNQISGWFDLSAEHPQAGVSGTLQVDLASLKTGIGLRDEHMRERHLHTEKYPYAYFELLSVSGMPATVEPGKKYSVVGDGYFYIHGVKRRISPQIEFSMFGQADSVSEVDVTAEFPLKLDDYGIKRPKALFMKLAETLDISVVFTARPNESGGDIQLPVWEEVK